MLVFLYFKSLFISIRLLFELENFVVEEKNLWNSYETGSLILKQGGGGIFYSSVFSPAAKFFFFIVISFS